MTAFTHPGRVVGGMAFTAAIAGVALHNAMMGTLEAAAAHRAARNDAIALDAWDRELRLARGDAAALGDLAKTAVAALLDAEDDAASLRTEVAALRRAVAERDAAIRALTA